MRRTNKVATARQKTAFITRFALLATTALSSLGAFSEDALAQAVIDGGVTETVPGTQAASWNVGGQLTVGDTQAGTLLIGPNGVVSSTSAVLGSANGSSGVVNLMGSDNLNPAIFGFGSTLVVGGDGAGALSLSNGLLLGLSTSVGSGASAVGTVSLSNASSWNNANSLVIGDSGAGSVRIEGGSIAQSGGTEIGRSAGSHGRLTITGQYSSWADTVSVTIGGMGAGELIIADSAVATTTSGDSIVGSQASGTALVTGAGSVWNTRDLFVGTHNGSTGILTIDQGAAVVTAGNAHVGLDSGARGFVNVQGPGSRWTVANTLSIGMDGEGAVTIENGGTVHAGMALIGNGPGRASVLVSGANSALVSDFGLGVGLGLAGQGWGSLQIENGGSVLVSASEAIIGYADGSHGTVTVTGKDSLFNVAAAELYVAGIGTTAARGELTVQNGAVVRVNGGSGTIHVAEGAGSIGFLNIGGNISINPPPGGFPAEAPGTVDAAAINLGGPGAQLNFFHTSGSYLFAPVIQGSGSVNIVSGTTILAADSSGFTGATTVYGGTLSVDGKLGGTLDVRLDGRLQGVGTIGNTVISGTIAPGNSIGTTNIAGNITFNAGSTYEVEVDASGQSDKIVASGQATINGGSVRVLAGMANYAPATTYTILTANGGRTGAFTEGVTSNLAFLDPSLSYDANNVYLTMTRNLVGFQNVGLTPNQVATGGGVESLGFGNPLYNAVLNLSVAQARSAFDQLSGEIHASARTALIEDSRFIRNAVNDRIRSAFDAVGAAMGGVVTYVDGKPVAVAAATDRLAVWGQGFGSWGHTDGDGNAARLNRSTGGFFIGADAPVFDTWFDAWRLGAVAGYSRNTFNVKDRQSSGTSDNYHLGLYGGTRWGDLAFRTGAATTWHDVSTSRSVIFPGFGNSVKGDYNAATAQIFGELAYGGVAGRARFEPFANLAYVNLHTNAFTEWGSAAALASSSANTDATFTTLGLRASTTFRLNGAVLTAKGMAGWRHAFDDVAPPSTTRFAGGGDAFSIGGVPFARNTAVVEAGLDYVIMPNATLGVIYGGQFGSGMSDQSVKADFNVRF